jgi:hypothetical protein
MLIEDLPYLEDASVPTVVSGAAGTLVLAAALALGSPAITFTRTKTRGRTFPNGGSLAIGWGFGFARGELTSAGVVTAGYGDIVVGATHSTPEISAKPVDVAFGVIIAIDLPS